MTPRTNAILAAALGAALVLPGCARSGSGSLGPGPTVSSSPSHAAGAIRSGTTPPSAATPTRPPSPAASSPRPIGKAATPNATPGSPGSAGKVQTFQVWFIRGGALTVTSRSAPRTPAVARQALRALVAGPSAAEAGAGVVSPIRTDTSFSLGLAGGVASVDLPQAFFSGGRTLARQRQAQVVFTLTQYPTISRVEFRLHGEGNMPVGRADYDDLLPAIVVTMPSIGTTVTSPVIVAGTANVFEATVSIRILDARGHQIATAFTTASCGTGCRGRYSTPVRFEVATPQSGRIQVYEVSAQNGARIHVVDIPVTLSP